MYLPSEIRDHDACALSRELMGFSLKEEDGWATDHQSVEDSGCDFKRTLDPSAERKILFQHDTILDRHMVSYIWSDLNRPDIESSLIKVNAAFSERRLMVAIKRKLQ